MGVHVAPETGDPSAHGEGLEALRRWGASVGAQVESMSAMRHALLVCGTRDGSLRWLDLDAAALQTVCVPFPQLEARDGERAGGDELGGGPARGDCPVSTAASPGGLLLAAGAGR